MNERIEELKNRALSVKSGDICFNGGEVELIDLEKFAELIVRECAYIAMREDHDPAECIIKYFGVKK